MQQAPTATNNAAPQHRATLMMPGAAVPLRDRPLLPVGVECVQRL